MTYRVLASVVVLCGCDSTRAVEDARVDAAVIVPFDASADAPSDVGADMATDVPPDSGVPCTPVCAGKCAGVDDGCGQSCDGSGCDGCCDDSLQCVGPASQSDAICGSGGEPCASCTVAGLSCEPAVHHCMSERPYNALFIKQDVPLILSPGATASVLITMRNIGTATWTAADAFHLGAHNPRDNSTWGLARVHLEAGDAIAPGEDKTFSFDITAPQAPGVHNFHWRMLKELEVWFGEFSRYQPIMVGGGGATVCEASRALVGTDQDARPAIQGCIDSAPAGGIVELPAGVYRVDGAILISQAPITLRTEGADITSPRCERINHSCAELSASTSFADAGGLLQVASAGTIVDHLVLNGNKEARRFTASGQSCADGSNSHGFNMRLQGDGCTVSNSVSHSALCGTGLEVSGAFNKVVVWRNTIAGNGVHGAQGMWADGLTVHDYASSTFAENVFVDNTDIDFILGGCQGCFIHDNTITHSPDFDGGAFAALMLHAWPGGATSGDYTGSDTSGNVIDCGSDRRCGFGLYIGPDAWYDADTFGGTVHHNTITRAEQGLLIDDAHHMEVYNNHVTDPAASTVASCGVRATTAYSMGDSSVAIDTSLDTMGTIYTSADWDGCIPNWWDQ